MPFTKETPFINLNFHINNKQGSIIAGIQSLMYCWGILYVDILFVEEVYRHQQLGSLLLHKVEAEGKSMGATLCHLDTLNFQAKDFYLKQGYEIFGILDDSPPGHQRYYLKKTYYDRYS